MKQSRLILALSLGLMARLIEPGSNAQGISGSSHVFNTQTVVRAVPPPQPPASSVDACLAWDSANRSLTVTNGTQEVHFAFNLTNISTSDVTISSATGSCSCTVAKMPELPWKIAPGGTGQISIVVNLVGKSGTLPKTVTVVTDKGTKVLYVTTTILPPAASQMLSAVDREKNQKIASADRQAVFRGECARCHAEPGKNKMGQALYVSVCGVCHEDEHRASMVPDLHAIKQETNAEFWRNWVTHGKPDSLMPAFAQSEGGILSEAQISSLVGYLTVAIPSHPQPQPQAKVDRP